MKKIIFRVGGSSSAANPPPPLPPTSAVAGGEGSGALRSIPDSSDQNLLISDTSVRNSSSHQNMRQTHGNRIDNSLAVGDEFVNWGGGKRPRRKLKSRYCRRAPPQPSGFPVYGSRNLEDNRMVVGGGNRNGVGGSSILTSVLGKGQCSGAESSDRKKIPSSSGGPSKKHRPNDSAQPQQPGIVIQLTKEEKEEDFLEMRGTKLPQKPMRRPRNVEKSLLYCFPGTFFSDVSSSKYEIVEEKKRSRKPRWSGLKGIVESSDSD